MIATNFYGCCGLRVIAEIVPNMAPTSKISAQDNVYNQIRSILQSHQTLVSGGQESTHNSSLIVLNDQQRKSFEETLFSLGYEFLKKFPNWNERKQPLYLYFKEGGPKADLPAPKTAPKVKDETLRSPPTASR
jgi:hypothetical protein